MNMRILRGTQEDWGLPSSRLIEIDAEIADHICCLKEQGDNKGAEQLKEKVNSPKVRRALTGMHIIEQVTTTLARWPSRREWSELMWLLIWFVVILISDVVAMHATHVLKLFTRTFAIQTVPDLTANESVWAIAAWLLQGISRAGFFTSFIVSLVRAWKTGLGVLLARVLQLKLIHTVLVVLAMGMYGYNQGQYGNSFQWIKASWPDLFEAPYLLVYGVLIVIVILIASKRRLWQWALGIMLLTLFIYPASPVRCYTTEECWPIAQTIHRDENSNIIVVPDDDPIKINEMYELRVNHGWDVSLLDIVSNSCKYNCYENARVIGTVMGRDHQIRKLQTTAEYQERYYSKRISHEYRLPLFSPQSALSWLAAPIPFLGLIGLLGMLVLMGRRSVQDMIIYGCLVFFALTSTFLPFFFNDSGGIINFTPEGIVSGPLPGFDSLLIGSPISEIWTLVLGLLLSAGVPWLLVALFLKPKPACLPDDTPRVVE